MVDVPGNSSTTVSIGVGGSIAGTLETTGDHDWYKIQLTAGQSISVLLDGIGLSDAYLRIRDASGNVVYENDDRSSSSLDSQVAFSATYTGTYYIDVGAYNDAGAGTYQLSVSPYSPPPLWSLDQISNQLVSGYWGGDSHHFAVTQGGTITVNLLALTSAGQYLARQALGLWSDVTGIRFVETAVNAQITFDDSEDGAFADGTWSGGITTQAHVNVSADWLADYGTGLNSYSFQTYIHEIGHALGLGHAGDYNGSANFPFDALYLNDSWATTVMSYFSQRENSYFAGKGFTEAYIVTPMLADLLAMSSLYGLATTTRTGNTTYGYNSNAGRDIYNASLYPDVAYTVFDSGGVDTLDYSQAYNGQRIDLNQESYSNVLGLTGNVSIARGTVIENAIGGFADDTLIGNSANNVLDGRGGVNIISYERATAGVTVNASITGPQDTRGAGVDTLLNYSVLLGSNYDDTLSGGAGQMQIDGGAGNDLLIASSDGELLIGNNGDDRFIGGVGSDTFNGGTGFDTVDFSSAAGGVVAGNAFSTSAPGWNGSDIFIDVEQLIGSRFDDRLSGASVMIGGDGNDIIGDVFGAARFEGGLGNDVYNVYSTQNVIVERANQGTDLVRSWENYTLGSNVENLDLLQASRTGTGNGLNNIITAVAGSNRLNGMAGDDTLYGGTGADRLDGGAGLDRMYGGAGDDLYYVRDATDFVYENAGEGTDIVYAFADVILSANVEDLRLTGTVGLTGTGNGLANRITGSDHADRIIGMGGDDRLFGGLGNDTLEGGSGYDRMYGGVGDDTYVASDATDYAYEYAGEGTDQVLSSVTYTLRANVENLTLTGTAAIKGVGNDLANVMTGNDAANSLTGNAGDDTLFGNGGDDVLVAGAGRDTLEGGAGRDRFFGGTEADSFVFRDGDFASAVRTGSDQIHDFSTAEDRIVLDRVDANTGAAGDQAFTFLGTDAFSGVAGQLRYQQISGNTYVEGDTNGDGVADFMIRLDGLHTLSSANFVF